MNWKRAGVGVIEIPIIDYLEKLFDDEIEKGNKLRVCVGTDSQRAGKGFKFATVILVIAEGTGGMVIGKTYYDKTLVRGKKGVKERMLVEVSKSIETAYELSPLLDLYGIPLEIHADINPNPERGESNKALAEAVGYILGMGYDFKVKPAAFAASCSADKLAN